MISITAMPVAFIGDEVAIIALPPHSNDRRSAMFKRRRFKQTQTLQERLATFANEARNKAVDLPPGLEQDDLLRKARQADTASHLDGWLNSPGLKAPD